DAANRRTWVAGYRLQQRSQRTSGGPELGHPLPPARTGYRARRTVRLTEVRGAALALLPAALHASGIGAAALAILLVLMSPGRRQARLALPVVGFLVAGGLTVAMNPSPTSLGAWSYWLVGAVVLLALY